MVKITELSSDHLSAKLIYFLLKRGPFSFQFMGLFNLSTTYFNTTHIMWNGSTLEQCTLPAFFLVQSSASQMGSLANYGVTWDESLRQGMK